MVSVFASSAVDRGLQLRSGQTKYYKSGVCCFSTKYPALRARAKTVWFAQNQDNVSEWSDISTHGLLFQRASTIKIKLSVSVEYKVVIIIISLIL